MIWIPYDHVCSARLWSSADDKNRFGIQATNNPLIKFIRNMILKMNTFSFEDENNKKTRNKETVKGQMKTNISSSFSQWPNVRPNWLKKLSGSCFSCQVNGDSHSNFRIRDWEKNVYGSAAWQLEHKWLTQGGKQLWLHPGTQGIMLVGRYTRHAGAGFLGQAGRS